ncbi:MAG: FtsQ-type POTRA domain-containing protein [Ruminococcaceae bacterium]|nr:FtsQ-type POTRA domain-containing protein [Oscillospiraceae bacterium]
MRRAPKKTEKVIEVNITRFVGALFILLMATLLTVGIVLFVRGILTVSEYDVTGDSPYDREEIISASGIRPGDKLYDIDAELAAENIMRECPYINKVEIDSRFPNTVKIDVSSLTASWYVEIAGDFYALDADLRVLEEVSDNSKFVSGSIPKLTLPNIKSAIVGETLIFGDDEAEIRFANEFMSMVKQTSFKSRLTLVDIENRFEIYINVDGKVNVYMGSTADAEAKLDAVEKALGDERLSRCVSAEIDASNPSAVYIRPIFSYDTPTDSQENAVNQ